MPIVFVLLSEILIRDLSEIVFVIVVIILANFFLVRVAVVITFDSVAIIILHKISFAVLLYYYCDD